MLEDKAAVIPLSDDEFPVGQPARLGPNGIGMTLLLRAMAHRALHDGRAVVPRRASDLLTDLGKQDSSMAHGARRTLEAYVRAQLLCIDDVVYISYDVRHLTRSSRSSRAARAGRKEGAPSSGRPRAS